MKRLTAQSLIGGINRNKSRIGINSTLSTEERKIISEIFPEQFYKVTYFNGIPYVAHLILELFEKTGIIVVLRRKYISVEEIMLRLNFIPEAKLVLDWILIFLHQYGFLKRIEKNGIASYRYDEACRENFERKYTRPADLDKEITPSCNLMEYVIREYPHYFKGSKTGFEIIFSSNRMTLWNDYFSNDNSGYRVYNAFGAFGVMKWFLQRDNIKLLELGGGTGSASSLLIEQLRKKNVLNNIGEYIFSDISPIFLRLGNIAIMNQAPEDFNVNLKKLDFNKSLVEQNINENSIDIVYGINALHVAVNLFKTLREIRKVIRPGGLIILSECIRSNTTEPLIQEVIFNLLEDYTNVEIDSCLRKTRGFLPYEEWINMLKAAGFRNVEIILNTDGLSSESNSTIYPKLAAVIKGVKVN